MRTGIRKVILCALLLVVTVIFSGRGRAAASITIQVNGGEPLSAATLRGGLDHYSYEEITDLAVLEGTLTGSDLTLLQNKTPQEPDASFLLPNLRSLTLEKAVVLPASLPTQFMFQHPQLEVLSIRCATPAALPELAFAQCQKLKTVELFSVSDIGASAFRSCQSLSTVEMKQVTALGSYAFSGCSGLTSVTFGEVAPAAVPDSTFPNHSFQVRVPKGQKSTYQQRLQHYTALIYEEYVTENSTSPDTLGNVSLSGTAQASYTVAVTPTISFGDMEKTSSTLERTLEVTAEQLFLEEGQSVRATVTSGSNEFVMKTGRNSEVPFRIINGEGEALDSNGVFALLTREGEKKSGKLLLNQEDLPYAGQYKGNLTFSFSLE